MLTGAELATAIAAVLFGAVGLGAFLHWLWLRLGPGRSDDAARIAEIGEQLHEAEMRCEAADLALRETEERFARREADLQRQLAESRADLETMQGGLVNARQRLYELEEELERLRSGV